MSARPDWRVDRYKPGSIKIGRSSRGIVIKGVNPEGLDLVVMQRVGTPVQVELVTAFQKNGVAVVVDVDDALHAIPRDNGSWAFWNRNPKHHWSHLDEACKRADLVTVTTDALATRYGKHGRVEKLVNGLPEASYASDTSVPEHDRVVIGWSGVRASHAGDLGAAGDSLRRVIDEDPNVFVKIVGHHEWAAETLRIPKERVLPESGPVPLSEYHEALQGTDVAIVPLWDNPFNKSKSALKALEYQAVGARVIASATPANVELAKVAGFRIAGYDLGSHDRWYQYLTESISEVRRDRQQDPMYRKALVERVQPLGISARAEEWANAWERAVNRRRNLS
jgi:O-antigen biosynthesis protein